MAMTTLRVEAPLDGNSSSAREAAFHGGLRQLLARLKAQGRSPAAIRQLRVSSPARRVDPRDGAFDRLWREVFGGFKPEKLLLEAASAPVVALAADLHREGGGTLPDIPVWHGLTPAAINQAYSARAAVPEHLDIFRRWREAGERFLASHEVHRDLAYGDDPLQRLDLFPARRPGAP